MLTIDEALEVVLAQVRPLSPVLCPLAELPGLRLAEDVAADIDSPPFDKALMDGYAVRAAEVPGPGAVLRLGEQIPAGQVASRPLAPGEAAVIMTGAPLPPGADAVVAHERTEPVGAGAVRIDTDVTVGMNRLPRGREMRAGEIVLRGGTWITPTQVGLLASVGRARVLVIPRPRVVVVPTGDELVEPDQVPGPGQIRNSHAVMIGALARQVAEAEVTPIAPDTPAGLRSALARGLQTADVLLITGGVSAGAFDLVPATLTDLGVTTLFHKVRLKPGKPLLFGVGPVRGKEGRPGALVFGLPGNPVGGLVGFHLFVVPALLGLLGTQPPALGERTVRGLLGKPFRQRGDRPTFYPARLSRAGVDDARVEPLDWAGSADLRTAALADGFALFPAGERQYEPGEAVEFLPMFTGGAGSGRICC